MLSKILRRDPAKALAAKKIHYIPISSSNKKVASKIEAQLKAMNKKNTAAILLGINSGGHKDSIVQADYIGTMVTRKKEELGVPLVTMAEDNALGPQMQLLMYGDTILADRVTMLGNIGYRMTPWLMKEMLNEKLWGSKVEFRHAGENKVRFNRFKDLRKEDVEWALNLFNHRINYIIDSIATKRGSKLSDEGRALLASGETILGTEAHRLGIIDLLELPNVYFQEKMPGRHIAFTKPDWKQKLGLASTIFTTDFSVVQDVPSVSLVDQLTASEQEVALTVEEAMMDVLCRQNVRFHHPMMI